MALGPHPSERCRPAAGHMQAPATTSLAGTCAHDSRRLSTSSLLDGTGAADVACHLPPERGGHGFAQRNAHGGGNGTAGAPPQSRCPSAWPTSRTPHRHAPRPAPASAKASLALALRPPRIRCAAVDAESAVDTQEPWPSRSRPLKRRPLLQLQRDGRGGAQESNPPAGCGRSRSPPGA